MKKVLGIAVVIVVALVAFSLIFGSLAGNLTIRPVEGEVRVRTMSRTCWSGAIDNATREGCGDATFTVSNDIAIVAVVQKQSGDQSGLTVEVWINGALADTATTTAAYGVVTVSATD